MLILFQLLGLLGAGLCFAISFWLLINRPGNRRVAPVSDTSRDQEIDLLVDNTQPDMVTKLVNVKPGDRVDLEEIYVVQTTGSLNPLWQRDGSKEWTEKPEADSFFIILSSPTGSDTVWLVKSPAREGGEFHWCMYHFVPSQNLADFFKKGNSGSGMGPGKEFNRYGKVREVTFQLPDNLTPGITWKVEDLGAYDVLLPERDPGEVVCHGDRIAYVDATSVPPKPTEAEPDIVEDQQWMLYLMPTGQGEGSGGLFVGSEFDPEVDVTDIVS